MTIPLSRLLTSARGRRLTSPEPVDRDPASSELSEMLSAPPSLARPDVTHGGAPLMSVLNSKHDKLNRETIRALDGDVW